MLDPNARQIYTDQLIPPENYYLDLALATTYSLDLMSLLMAPVSMTLHNYRASDAAINDPIALLEALYRSADRFLVFCQKGRISIPVQSTLLYSYLEKVVVEVQPQNTEGVFHPKTWLLRYVEKEKSRPVIYRFLCLSRNLTFDKSWDTVLVLEGSLDEKRKSGIGLNRPLGQFYRSLPELADHSITGKWHDSVMKMADEVTRVHFVPPTDFEGIKKFVPVGIPGNMRFPRPKSYRKALIVSPFISAQMLKKITDIGKQNVAISRLDTLDDIPLQTYKSIEKNTDFFVLDDVAENPYDFSEKSGDFGTIEEIEDLSGLHAKLIITENGTQVTVYTGSANITNPAFSGRNIEFMVALSGQRKRVGINRFLGDEDSRMSFRNMLVPYERESDAPTKNETRIMLENMLECFRQHLLNIKIKATVDSESENAFNLIFSITGGNFSLHEEVSGKCRPITLPEPRSKDIRQLLLKKNMSFRELTLEALTGFLAFKLEARKGSEKVGLSFVLNLPVEGMPNERDSGVLQNILSDQETFIRYLLLILGTVDQPIVPAGKGTEPGVSNSGRAYLLPLFEEMVRAFSREPEKIERISAIIDELKKTGDLKNTLPPGFDEIWQAFRGNGARDR